MQTNFKSYDFNKSLERLDEILNSTSTFDEKNSIPKRSDLTYTNGFYVKCSVLFVDLRGSSKIPKVLQKKVLAKIYRSCINEIVAILNGFSICKEINIVGDCVCAIFESTSKTHIDDVLQAAAQVNSLISILNYKLGKKGYKTIKAGIGLSSEHVLMFKAGYSTINDVVWMGNAVNQASKMCSKANKNEIKQIVITPLFYKDLCEGSQKYFTKSKFFEEEYYHCDVADMDMNNWLKEQRIRDAQIQQKSLW